MNLFLDYRNKILNCLIILKEKKIIKLPENFIKGAAGAGDAFAAGFILGMNDSESLKSCLHLGVCSAASCLSDPTTSGGVMRMEQCLDLGNKYGFRSFE